MGSKVHMMDVGVKSKVLSREGEREREGGMTKSRPHNIHVPRNRIYKNLLVQNLTKGSIHHMHV